MRVFPVIAAASILVPFRLAAQVTAQANELVDQFRRGESSDAIAVAAECPTEENAALRRAVLDRLAGVNLTADQLMEVLAGISYPAVKCRDPLVFGWYDAVAEKTLNPRTISVLAFSLRGMPATETRRAFEQLFRNAAGDRDLRTKVLDFARMVPLQERTRWMLEQRRNGHELDVWYMDKEMLVGRAEEMAPMREQLRSTIATEPNLPGTSGLVALLVKDALKNPAERVGTLRFLEEFVRAEGLSGDVLVAAGTGIAELRRAGGR